MTIAAWVKITDNDHFNIVTDYVGGVRYFSAGCTVGQTTGKLCCMVWDDDPGVNYWPTSTSDITENTWTHVAFVFEAGIGYRFYIDGDLDGNPVSDADLEMFNYTSSQTKLLGKGSFTGTPYFDGKLDNVMVFNRALSDSEIKYLYESTDEDDLTEVVHDAAGNMTLDHRGYSYSYDHDNRLTKITKRDDGGDPDTVAEFTYDALGRRIEKIDSIAGTTTRYYYDGWRVLSETNAGGAIQRNYTYGNYLDEALIMVDSSSDDHYYAHNHLFSPVALLADDGSIEEYYEYDAYGKATVITDDGGDGDWWDGDETIDTLSAEGNPILFTGQRLDTLDSGDLQLMYYKNRYYCTNTGRFLQRDPIEYTDSMNRYEYVASGPTTKLDTYGLFGGDIHEDLTIEMAKMAGLSDDCANVIGDYNNHVDKLYPPGYEPLNRAYDKFYLLAGGMATEQDINDYLNYLNDLRKWHFPVSKDGWVHPGSRAAGYQYRKGIAGCDLKQFARGLHSLQDSWSHQGKPYKLGLGHWRGLKKKEVPIKRKICIGSPAPGMPQICLPIYRVVGYRTVYELHIGDWDAFFSDETDQAEFWHADVRAAGLATYDAILEFFNNPKCECLCKKVVPGRQKNRAHVTEWLNRRYPGDNQYKTPALPPVPK